MPPRIWMACKIQSTGALSLPEPTRWVYTSLRVEFTQACALPVCHRKWQKKTPRSLILIILPNRNPVSIIQKCTYLQSSTVIWFLTWCEQNVAASEAANFAIAASCKWQCALNLLQSCYNTIERTDQIYFNWHTVSCDCNITFWTSFMCSCVFV